MSLQLKSAPPDDVARLLLVRHGATPANELRPYILQGQSVNHGLSATGRTQAAALGKCLGEFAIDEVVASPLVRAQETAQAVAERHRTAVVTLEEITEVDVGTWESRSWGDIMERWPEEYARFMENPGTVPYLDGESYFDVARRSEPAIRDYLDSRRGRTTVVVAHNVVNRTLIARWLGLDGNRAREIAQENTCINVVEFNGAFRVRSMNGAFHLG